MEGYTCAYRDTKSPLTPIVPIGESSFNFVVKSEDGKETPYPHKIKGPIYLTPQCQRVETPTPTFEITKTPKFLKPLNQLKEKNQDLKTITQSHQKIRKSNYLTPQNQTVKNGISQNGQQPKQRSNDVTPKSRFSEKQQNLGENCNSNYNVKYSKREIKIQINNIEINKENGDVNISSKKKCLIYFKKVSPVKPKTLSPRVKKILQDTGMTQYMKLFENEEIDFQVFQMLTTNDLKQLGININDHLNQLVKAINFWKND